MNRDEKGLFLFSSYGLAWPPTVYININSWEESHGAIIGGQRIGKTPGDTASESDFLPGGARPHRRAGRRQRSRENHFAPHHLYDKNGGQVTVCGYDMDTQEREAKDRLGLVLDEMMYEKGLSGLGNARLYGRLYHHFNESLFLELCERFKLPPNRKLGLLSTGFKMRFQFAFALSHNARLFLMDEPASSVRTLDVADTAAAVQKIGFVSGRSGSFSGRWMPWELAPAPK